MPQLGRSHAPVMAAEVAALDSRSMNPEPHEMAGAQGGSCLAGCGGWMGQSPGEQYVAAGWYYAISAGVAAFGCSSMGFGPQLLLGATQAAAKHETKPRWTTNSNWLGFKGLYRL